MWVEIIYWIGVLCTVLCMYDLFMTKRQTGVPVKLLVAVAVIFLSWIGIAIYYLFLRSRLK